MTFTKRIGALTIATFATVAAFGQLASAAVAPEQGVRLPLTYTDADQIRLQADYDRCLKDRGVRFVPNIVIPAGPAVEGTEAPAPGQEAKVKLCASKKVLQPIEMETSYPGYKANFTQWVKLLNEAGVGVVEIKGGWNFTEAYAKNPMSDAKQRKIERETRIKAFSS